MSTYTATFTFEGDENVGRIVNEILMDPSSYNHAKLMANNGKEFMIEYTFEEKHQEEIIGIGNGYIDSEEDY